MIFINRKPLARRTFLKGGGVALALPYLEAMMPTKAHAQQNPKRFIGFFYPNGTSPTDWQPSGTKLSANNLSKCLEDLSGFGAEGIWPACGSLVDDISVVNNLHHDVYGAGIHTPMLSLSAHAVQDNKITAPSLDQKILERNEHKSIHPYINMSATSDTGISQGYLSFRAAATPADVDRSPRVLFDRLFGAPSGSDAETDMLIRNKSILDFVLTEATELNKKLGREDRARVEEFQNSIRELESQIEIPKHECVKQEFAITQDNWHDKTKMFIDIITLAMQCDLTRVATIQYSNSWGVNYSGYVLGDGKPDEAGTIGTGQYSDHFISHKLGDRDRAKDLDDLPRDVAKRIADNRVILTSRFKVRRFSYLVDKLRSTNTPTGNLLDDSLALYCSEIGNGDSHGKRNMPTLIAGRAGGFAPGRIINANGQHTAALHGAILNRFGFNLSSYGNPAESPLPGV